MKVKMLQMGFGESIVVDDDANCLMIDCGSLCPIQNNINCFANAVNTITNYDHIEAMITHFHEDHINGFMYMIDPNNNFSKKFDKAYIPNIFTRGQGTNLIDYMLMYHYLANRNCPHKKFSLLELLKRMVQKNIPFKLLKRGDTFYACGSQNLVLWPQPDYLKNIGREKLKENLPLPEFAVDEIFKISDEICEIFLECAENWGSNISNQNMISRIDILDSRISSIDEQAIHFDNNGYIKFCNGFYLPFTQYKDYDNIPSIEDEKQRIYKAMITNDNKWSIVFQTNSNQNFLFTGDVPAPILKRIVNNDFRLNDGINIHKEFFAIKAPHHGTNSHYCKDLFGANSAISKEVVFISNGKYNGNAGPIGNNYITGNYRMICTNYDKGRCDSSNCQHHSAPGCNILLQSSSKDII